jgi:hypothetical protein
MTEVQTNFTQAEHYEIWNKLPISDDRRQILLKKVFEIQQSELKDNDEPVKYQKTQEAAQPRQG